MHIPKTHPVLSFKTLKLRINAAVTNLVLKHGSPLIAYTPRQLCASPYSSALYLIFHSSQGDQILDDDVDFTESSTCRQAQRCVVLVALMTVIL